MIRWLFPVIYSTSDLLSALFCMESAGQLLPPKCMQSTLEGVGPGAVYWITPVRLSEPCGTEGAGQLLSKEFMRDYPRGC